MEQPLVVSEGPRSNVDHVAEALRATIASGGLRPGDRIKETHIARQLGTSRGPVRDALRILHEEGLVLLRPNVGAVVPTVTADDVLEVYALRATIGSVALRKLVNGAPAIEVIRPSFERLLAAAGNGDEDEFTLADLAFQDAIVRGSGLRRATQFFERLTLQVRVFVATLQMTYRDRLTIIVGEDTAIFNALVAGDVTAAEAAWREKFYRWMVDFTSRVGSPNSDADLWLRLTGRATPAMATDGIPGPG